MKRHGVLKREKAMTDRHEMLDVITRSTVCRLGLVDGNEPYIVPLCFGYLDDVLYFHAGERGRKLSVIERNDRVCVEFDVDTAVVAGDEPCSWTMRYRSVVGFGRASLVTGYDEKQRALAVIMDHYSAVKSNYLFPRDRVEKTRIIRIDIEYLTGKKSGC